uniref:Uncharacterized protein n=1 Tax=Aegilops tauschii subsp. strangulata TaxID=200361 RepID=A0A453SX27_AEGTS
MECQFHMITPTSFCRLVHPCSIVHIYVCAKGCKCFSRWKASSVLLSLMVLLCC